MKFNPTRESTDAQAHPQLKSFMHSVVFAGIKCCLDEMNLLHGSLMVHDQWARLFATNPAFDDGLLWHQAFPTPDEWHLLGNAERFKC